MLDGWNAIEPRRGLLQKAMPMQRSAFRIGPRAVIASDVVAHVNSDGVPPIGFDCGSWECSIDEKSADIHSIGRNVASSDVEIVCGPRP